MENTILNNKLLENTILNNKLLENTILNNKLLENTILCKEGYLIPKTEKYKSQIEILKKELKVEPYQPYTFSKNDTNLKFDVYQENENYYNIPKFYGLKRFGKPDENKEIIGSEIDIKFNGDLRPIQKEIIDKVVPHIKQHDGGVLVLPCAAGKTVLSLYLASLFKVKTLVIVHKTFLLNQWKERAEQFTNARIGIIQQNKIEIDGKDIVIGMLQSIARDKYDEDIFRDFGLVIFDEAHHAPSQYFSKALPLIASKLTIGLSATPKRTDRLEKILYWYFGEIMYKAEVEENNKVLVNIINYDIEHEKFKEFLMYTGDVNRPKTINKITTIGRRNKFIIDCIEETLQEDGRRILILSDRIEHLQTLKNRLDEREIASSDFYIGGMKAKALEKAKLAQVIFASYGMASEGLDIPELNTLFMVTSRKEVEQAVGRVIRKVNPIIRPLIYDFTDQLPSFVNQGRHRRKLYKKMGFEIKITEVKNNMIIREECISELTNIKESISVNNNECDFID
jgi:superfamily II DNA or RNA helicase